MHDGGVKKKILCLKILWLKKKTKREIENKSKRDWMQKKLRGT